MLAAVWAIKKCRLYLLGMPHVQLLVDHEPLIPLTNHYTLDMIENTRLQRLRAKSSMYTFTAVWRKGLEHSIPDALSRAPTSDPAADDEALAAAVHLNVSAVILNTINAIDLPDDAQNGEQQHSDDPLTDGLQRATSDDRQYLELLQLVETGFPASSTTVTPNLRHYWKLRAELSSEDGIVLFNSRIVNPQGERLKILRHLHASHQGIVQMKQRARQTVYWPGMTSDITKAVSKVVPTAKNTYLANNRNVCVTTPPHRMSLNVWLLISLTTPGTLISSTPIDSLDGRRLQYGTREPPRPRK